MEEEKNLLKEQILEQSRKENKNGDEREKKHTDFSFKVGLIVFVIFAVAIAITEYVIYGEFRLSIGLIPTIWGVCGSVWLARGILNRRKVEIVLGALNSFLAIGWFVFFIFKMLNWFL